MRRSTMADSGELETGHPSRIDCRKKDGLGLPSMPNGRASLNQGYLSGFSNMKRRMRWHGLAAANAN